MADPEFTFADVARLTEKLQYVGTALRTYKILKLEDLYSMLLIKFPTLDHDEYSAIVRLMFMCGLAQTDRPGTPHRRIRWTGEPIDPDTTIHLFVVDDRASHARLRNGALHPVCIHCGRVEMDPIHLK